MDILFLSDNFPPEVNAAASRVFECAVYWAKWGHKVTVITCAPNFPAGKVYDGYKNKWYKKEMIDGVTVIRVKSYMAKNEGFLKRTLDFMSYMFMAIIASFFQKKPDIVVATSPQFFTAIAGYVIGLIKRRPFIFEISDLWPESIKAVGAMKNNRLLKALEKVEIFLYKKAKHIIAQTEFFMLNLVDRKIDFNKISVVMNGVNNEIFYPMPKTEPICKKLNIDKSVTTIGYIGTHGMAHGLNTILETSILMKDLPRFCFSFVGEGAAKKSLIQYKNANKIKNTTFNAAIAKKDMPDVWAAMDIVLIPLLDRSTFSGVVPSKLYEAMAMGKLIILITPEGEASRVLLENDAGVHIAPNSPALLKETILSLVSNPRLMERYKGNAREASMIYSRENQAKKMIRILERQC